MTKQYDEETQKAAAFAIEDLQSFMASAGGDATEASLLSWQKGYIAGVNRAMGIRNG